MWKMVKQLVFDFIDIFAVNVIVNDELCCSSNIKNCSENIVIDFIVCDIFYRCNNARNSLEYF